MDTKNKDHLVYVGYFIDQNQFNLAIQNNPNLSQARQNFERNFLTELVNQTGTTLKIASYFPCDSFCHSMSEINGKKIDVFNFSMSLKSCIKAFFAFRNYLVKNEIQDCTILFYSVQPVLFLAT